MLITSYQENSTSLSHPFLDYTGKSSLFQSNRISPWLRIPLGKLRSLIEPLNHLKERSKEHEQNGFSQRGSQGGQYQKRGPGSGGALKKKDTVALVGFGTFKVAQRKARKGINPRTGEEIKIKAKKVAKFVPGKALKDAVS